MALYFLSYDLRKARNYQQLYDALESLDAVRIVESTWCFKHNGTNTVGLRDHFKQFIDSDDGLIVSKVDGWASIGTDNTPKDLP